MTSEDFVTANEEGTGPAGERQATGAKAPGDGTRAVRAGLPEPVKYEPTLPGPVFAAHFHLPGDPTGPYTYGRDENPTWTLLEQVCEENNRCQGGNCSASDSQKPSK